MSTLLSILPLLGSLASIVLGLIGLIRPAFFMRVTDLQPTSPKGKLEMRAIFGGCLIALGLVCLVTAAPRRTCWPASCGCPRPPSSSP